jgi:hypothetical protein
MDDVKLYYADKPEFAGGIPSITPTVIGGDNNDTNGENTGGGTTTTPTPTPTPTPNPDPGTGNNPSTGGGTTSGGGYVKDDTDKNPDFSGLAQNTSKEFDFEFTAKKPSSAGASNVPKSNIVESRDDIFYTLIAAAFSLVIITCSTIFKKKSSK